MMKARGIGADFGARAGAAPAFTVQGQKLAAPVTGDPAASGGALPWWIWPVGASVVGGVLGYLSVQKGWF